MIMVSYVCSSFGNLKSSSAYIIWENNKIDSVIKYPI